MSQVEYYLGKLCPHKHEHGDTGQSLRYCSTGRCVVCKNINNKKYNNPEYQKAYRKANRDKLRKYHRAYYLNNIKALKEYGRNYYLQNREKLLARKRQRRQEQKQTLKRE